MRLFISHGIDKGKADELGFLDALEAALQQPDAQGRRHDILLDRTRLEAGDDWPGVLNDWLAECQAAVILLTPRALTRPWVLKEATLLAFRHGNDGVFPLLPVLLAGVDAAALAQHPNFAALGLPDIQAYAPGLSPQAVAADVLQRLQRLPLPATTPLDRLERRLEAEIGHGDADALDRACEELFDAPVAWRPDVERRQQRARVFARAIARGRLGRIGTLAGLTRALNAAALDKARAREVLKLAASVWVDEEVAARLRAVIAAPAARRPLAAALNSGRIEHGARMAVWRAQLPDIADNVYCVAGGGADDSGEELARRLCAEFQERNKAEVYDVDDAAAVLAAMTDPVFFVLPPPLPDRALTAELQRRFPSAVFIAHTGAALPAALPDHVLPLSPGLPAEAESISRADYVTATQNLR